MKSKSTCYQGRSAKIHGLSEVSGVLPCVARQTLQFLTRLYKMCPLTAFDSVK